MWSFFTIIDMNKYIHWNMHTKSKIQLITEAMALKASFCESLKEVNETYYIVNNVFGVERNGLAVELTEGYYGEVATYDTLDEALDNINPQEMHKSAVRIHDGKYSIGYVYNSLADVKESLIVDLDSATIL